MSKIKTFSLDGTSCASCEVVIERELTKMSKVRSVKASHSKKLVTVHLEEGQDINSKDIDSVLAKHGYLVSERSKNPDAESEQFQTFGWSYIAGILVVIFGLYLILRQTGIFLLTPNIENVSGLLGVLVIGLIASFSSCAAVLEGLVTAVSASAAKRKEQITLEQKMWPHYLFNLGRIIGFLFFGAVIGWIGQSIQLSTTANGLFVLIIAIIMLGLGINLLNLWPKGALPITPPKWLSHKIHDLSSSHHPAVPAVLGAFTFFLPCGFTQAMQLFALSLGDPKSSALIMGVFALGTVPALLGIGWITSKSKGRMLKRITNIAGVLVLLLGMSNAENALAILDWYIIPSFASDQVEVSDIEYDNKEQVIKMDVTSVGVYSPDILTVIKDVPVRWEITGADFMGCANTLVMRTFGVSTNIKPGLNIVEFTPTKTGSFTFSCSMGMVRGTMKVIEK
ncbi:sulfite exporter TauE/SafE family protein [Patescibacteria group bacterium]|nr:sulfite exporter TauE/SafE family protein [Patescibacteria group bacterium]